jgi:hypothetical protein
MKNVKTLMRVAGFILLLIALFGGAPRGWAAQSASETAGIYYQKLKDAPRFHDDSPQPYRHVRAIIQSFRDESMGIAMRIEVAGVMFRLFGEDIRQGKMSPDSEIIGDLFACLSVSASKEPEASGLIWTKSIEGSVLDIASQQARPSFTMHCLASKVNTPAMKALVRKALDAEDSDYRSIVLNYLKDSATPVEYWQDYVLKYKGKRDDVRYAESQIAIFGDKSRTRRQMFGDFAPAVHQDGMSLDGESPLGGGSNLTDLEAPKSANANIDNPQVKSEAASSGNSDSQRNYWLGAVCAIVAACLVVTRRRKRIDR